MKTEYTLFQKTDWPIWKGMHCLSDWYRAIMLKFMDIEIEMFLKKCSIWNIATQHLPIYHALLILMCKFILKITDFCRYLNCLDSFHDGNRMPHGDISSLFISSDAYQNDRSWIDSVGFWKFVDVKNYSDIFATMHHYIDTTPRRYILDISIM